MSSTKERNISFSIELVSRNQVKRVSLPDGSGDRLMVEGSLGGLTGIELVEDVLLEIRGTSGILRIDLSKEELEDALKRKGERIRRLLNE